MRTAFFTLLCFTSLFALSLPAVAKTGILIFGNNGEETFLSSETFKYVKFVKDYEYPEIDSLEGTSWKILSDTSGDFLGLTITFNADGSVSYTGFEDPDDGWLYSKWTINGDILKVVLGQDGPDDYIEGKFVIDGDKATYTFSWYDYFGHWGGEDNYIMTLERI